MTPQEELDILDAVGPGPYFISPALAEACEQRYGRLPKNMQIIKQLPADALLSLEPWAPRHSPTELVPRGAQWKRETRRHRRR